MSIKIKNINSTLLMTGVFSFLSGITIATKVYNKLNKPVINDDEKNMCEIDNSNKEILEKVKESKRRGYFILISTMAEYNKKKPFGNFLDFMKDMWKEDYQIILKSKDDISYRRDYSRWEYIFNKVQKL